MSVSASDPGAWSEVTSEASCIPTSMDAELISILTKAVEDLELNWAAAEQLSKCWMDRCFLGASHQADVPQRPAPFFPDLHEELTHLWRSPSFSPSPCTRNSASHGSGGGGEKRVCVTASS